MEYAPRVGAPDTNVKLYVGMDTVDTRGTPVTVKIGLNARGDDVWPETVTFARRVFNFDVALTHDQGVPCYKLISG